MKNVRHLGCPILVLVCMLFTRCATQPVSPEVASESSEVLVLSSDFPLIGESWSVFDLYSGLGIGMYDLKILDDGFSIYLKTETTHGVLSHGEPFSYSPFEGYFEGRNTTYKDAYLVASDENQRYFALFYRDGEDYILSIMDDSIFTEFFSNESSTLELLEDFKPFIRTQVRLIQ